MADTTRSHAQGTELMLILLAIGTLNLVDRNLPFIMAEDIKRDLAMSDTQIGLLGGLVFAVVYTFAGIPIAKLCDRGYARQSVAAAVAFWSVMTAIGGASQNFVQLVLARFGLAAGEAASAPAAHSIISAEFPAERRATMIAVYSVAAPIGAMLGLMSGGLLVAELGWRMAFVAVGIPGLLIAAIAWWRLPPPRLHDIEVHPSLGESVRHMLRLPTFRRTAVATSLYSFAGYAMTTFNAPVLMRSHGLSPAETGLWYGLMTGVAGMIGMLSAGMLADRLSLKDPSWRLRISAYLMAVSAPFLAGAMLADNAMLAVLLLIGPQMLTVAYLGPTFAAMHAIVPPHMRAMATSCLMGALTLLGALGPLAVGMLSDWLVPTYGKDSLAMAMLLAPVMLMGSSLAFVLAARAMPGDLYEGRLPMPSAAAGPVPAL